MNRRSLISITLTGVLVLILLPVAGRASIRGARGTAGIHALTAERASRAGRRGEVTHVAATVIARHLDQPKKLTLTPTGDLVVALSGDGVAPRSCTDSDELSCEDHSGAVDEVTPRGVVSVLASGLTSISSGHDDSQATGPVQARLIDGRLQVLFQDLDLNARTGISTFGSDSLLGDLASFPVGSGSNGDSGSAAGPDATVLASLGSYEARHEPDRHARGSAVRYGWEAAVNSDPYSYVAYRGGWAVADAGANDVLWISPAGVIRVLAVLPTISEPAKAGTYGSAQRHAIIAAAQSVPTAVSVGPDGALYVGELGGAPFAVGSQSVYRIVPGHRASVWASGLTSIGDIAWDSHGRLLVLELDRKGLSDPGLNDNHPASGELIRISTTRGRSGLRAASERVLINRGLSMPTGLVSAPDGEIYLTNDGTTTDGGQILAVTVS